MLAPTLGDTHEHAFVTARVLPWHEPEPGDKVAAILGLHAIALLPTHEGLHLLWTGDLYPVPELLELPVPEEGSCAGFDCDGAGIDPCLKARPGYTAFLSSAQGRPCQTHQRRCGPTTLMNSSDFQQTHFVDEILIVGPWAMRASYRDPEAGNFAASIAADPVRKATTLPLFFLFRLAVCDMKQGMWQL